MTFTYLSSLHLQQIREALRGFLEGDFSAYPAEEIDLYLNHYQLWLRLQRDEFRQVPAYLLNTYFSYKIPEFTTKSGFIRTIVMRGMRMVGIKTPTVKASKPSITDTYDLSGFRP